MLTIVELIVSINPTSEITTSFLPRIFPYNFLVIPIPYKIQTRSVPSNLGSVYEKFKFDFGNQIKPIIIDIVNRTNPIIAE